MREFSRYTSRCRGGLKISGNGVHMYKGVGVRFADFVSFILKSHENEIKFGLT